MIENADEGRSNSFPPSFVSFFYRQPALGTRLKDDFNDPLNPGFLMTVRKLNLSEMNVLSSQPTISREAQPFLLDEFDLRPAV